MPILYVESILSGNFKLLYGKKSIYYSDFRRLILNFNLLFNKIFFNSFCFILVICLTNTTTEQY